MKTVLITGCSSGFGKRMVCDFLKAGWRVIATSREIKEHPLFEIEEAYPNQLTLLPLELTNRSAVESFVTTYLVEVERIDCLILNAGSRLYGALENLEEEQIRYHLEVNFTSQVILTQKLLPFVRQAKGTIIFVTSIFGYIGYPLTSIHCATKHALEGFAESLYYELAPHGVKVAIVEPGASKSSFGKNLYWGEKSFPIYQGQTAKYKELQSDLSQNCIDRAELVSRKVIDLAEERCSRLRARVGRDARITSWFQRFPEKIRLPLTRYLYRRIFEKK